MKPRTRAVKSAKAAPGGKRTAERSARERVTRKPGTGPEPSTAATEIHAVVRAIPRGRVATYGQIGALIGIPAGHRVVARAMRTCPDGLPWHRVVGKKDARRARIAVQDPEHVALQRTLLAREGVTFDQNGFIVLEKWGWLPA